ncbi:hypothetical protein FJY93_00005 [Candidatus Kaiserbacteria bacterium]|nr:hypothetical protein [Candidatus Kaiserbacteria bacterium]
MCAFNVVLSADGRICGVHDWTEGPKPLTPPRKIVTQDDVLARAVWLDRRGQSDEADELLDRYITGLRA